MKHWILGLALVSLAGALSAAPLVAGPNEGFVLLNNASVFKEKSLGTLEWSENAVIGDKVTLLSGVVKMRFNGNERDYYKVKLTNGKEGYLRTSMVGVGGTLGVVKTDGALVYSEPRDVKISARTLTRGQLVVVAKDDGADSFIQLFGWDAAKDVAFDDTYVDKADVSVNDVDANALILLVVAKGQKNDAVKKNLLTLASTKYSTSLFQDLIKAQLDLLAPAPRATKAASGAYTLNDDKVNVRDLPNEKGSKVVATLEKGRSVTVVEVTADSYTVDGVTAPWYRIADPAGWIFGSFLTAP